MSGLLLLVTGQALLMSPKVQICEIMSGGFAVKIQQCVKKSPAVFGNFFILLKYLQFC